MEANELIIKEAIAPAKDIEIELFEQKHNFKLPEDYKSFIKNLNPKYIVQNLIRRGEEKYIVHGFYPFGDIGISSSQGIYEHFAEYLEYRYMPFAYDPGGRSFVVCLKGDDYGKIYCYRCDLEIPEALSLVSDSFTNFIKSIEMNNIV